MQTNEDMILKFKDSFSQKSFSTTSFQSSLICNSKTIRLDVNLVDGFVLASTNDFSAKSECGKELKKNKPFNRNAQNVKNSKRNKSIESSRFKKKSSEGKKINKFSNTGGTLKSFAGDEKSNDKTPVSHSYQIRNCHLLNPIQTRTEHSGSESKSFRCDVCLKYFSSKRNVKRHGVLHSLERHACETCGKVFQTKENLKRHCRAIHEVQVKSIACSHCYKAFSRKLDLKIHLKKHPDHM